MALLHSNSSIKAPTVGEKPTVGESFPEIVYEVRVRCSITKLIAVEMQEQTFTAEFRLEASWQSKENGLFSSGKVQIDPERTNWRNGNLYLIGSDEKFFSPQIYIKNMKEEVTWEHWGAVYPVPKDKNAVVCYRVTGVAVFQEIMELQNFPVDTQKLTMKIMSFHQAPRKSTDVGFGEQINGTGDREDRDHESVVLIENCAWKYRSFVNTTDFVMQHEYDLLMSMFFRTGVSDPAESASLRCYPELYVSAVITRKLGYWWSNVILPIFLISSTACAAFAVPATDVADRCSITLTILLTTVAYKYVVVEKLPEIPYLTIVDYYILSILLFQILLTLVFTVMGGFAITREKDSSDFGSKFWEFSDYPVTSTFVYLCILVVGHIIFYIWLTYKRRSIHIRITEGGCHRMYIKCFNPEYCIGGAKQHEGEEQLISDFCKASRYLNALKGTGVVFDEMTLRKTWRLSMRYWTWDEALEHFYESGGAEDGIQSQSKSPFSVLSMQTEESEIDFYHFPDIFTKFHALPNSGVDKVTGENISKPELKVFESDTFQHSYLDFSRLRPDWKVFCMDRRSHGGSRKKVYPK